MREKRGRERDGEKEGRSREEGREKRGIKILIIICI